MRYSPGQPGFHPGRFEHILPGTPHVEFDDIDRLPSQVGVDVRVAALKPSHHEPVLPDPSPELERVLREGHPWLDMRELRLEQFGRTPTGPDTTTLTWRTSVRLTLAVRFGVSWTKLHGT